MFRLRRELRAESTNPRIGNGPMWFLVRTVFWLGLVFTRIDWHMEPVVAPSAEAVASLATTEIGAICAVNPRTCVRAAAKAGELAGKASAAVSAPPPKTRGRV